MLFTLFFFNRTPFHADVLNSFSWSVNVHGQKKWILFPPGEEDNLRDTTGNTPFDVTDFLHNRKYFTVIQNSGDALFVPSSWYHQVWNLVDTISVNHNWINGCNVQQMWNLIKNDLDNVKKEISDCEDMVDFIDHCQVMLKSSCGMDFCQFFQFLLYISQKRIDLIKNNIPITLPHNRTLGRNHAVFDLKQLKEVIGLFKEHRDLPLLKNSKNLADSSKNLYNEIVAVLNCYFSNK